MQKLLRKPFEDAILLELVFFFRIEGYSKCFNGRKIFTLVKNVSDNFHDFVLHVTARDLNNKATRTVCVLLKRIIPQCNFELSQTCIDFRNDFMVISSIWSGSSSRKCC